MFYASQLQYQCKQSLSCLHSWNRDIYAFLPLNVSICNVRKFCFSCERICIQLLQRRPHKIKMFVFYLATANILSAFSLIINFQICEYPIILRPSVLSPTGFKTVKKFRRILWETQICLQTNWSCCLIPIGKQPTHNYNLLQNRLEPPCPTDKFLGHWNVPLCLPASSDHPLFFPIQFPHKLE